MSVTYFVALPFVRSAEGDLAPGAAVECRSHEHAVRQARILATTNAGAIAFAHSGDPAIGEFQDATVIQSFGEELSADELSAD